MQTFPLNIVRIQRFTPRSQEPLSKRVERLLAACRESCQFALPPLVCLTLSKWGLTAAFFASYSSGGQLFDS